MAEKLEIEIPQVDRSVSEAFKAIRTNLVYSGDCQVIAVTSAHPDEGKTVTALQLAVHYALLDKRVLLIDCDMKRPSLRKLLKIKGNINGVSEYLSRQSNEVLFSTNVKNLYLLPAGKTPPNSAELLSNGLFGSLISKLREQFDYIIIDTPPCTSAVDIQIIGTMTDGVVLVIRNDHSHLSIVKSSVEQLRRNNIRILGAVFNGVKKSGSGYYYNYYYNYY